MRRVATTVMVLVAGSLAASAAEAQKREMLRVPNAPDCDECCMNYADTWRSVCPSCHCANGGCGSERALRDQPDREHLLGQLRQFEGAVLRRSDRGRRLIELYRAFSPRVGIFTVRDPEFRAATVNFLRQAAPVGASLARGTGDRLIVDERLVRTTTSFLSQLARIDSARSDGRLARAIHEELPLEEAPRYVGMTVDAAWAAFTRSPRERASRQPVGATLSRLPRSAPRQGAFVAAAVRTGRAAVHAQAGR